MNIRHLTHLALLTTIAVIIFMFEAVVPPPVPVPGVKLGLANIVTLFALYQMGARDAFLITICRILLGLLLSGLFATFLYSLSGGVLSFLVMMLLSRFFDRELLWVVSVFGAITHNAGQILVAILLTQTPMIIVYLPVLIVSGVITGLFTGFAAKFFLKHNDKLGFID